MELSIEEKAMFIRKNDIERYYSQNGKKNILEYMKGEYPKGIQIEDGVKLAVKEYPKYIELHEFEGYETAQDRLKNLPLNEQIQQIVLHGVRTWRPFVEGMTEEQVVETIDNSDIFSLCEVPQEYRTEKVMTAILGKAVKQKGFATNWISVIEKFPQSLKDTAVYQQGMAMATGSMSYVTTERYKTPRLYQYVLDHLSEYSAMCGSRAYYWNTLPEQYQTRENALLCCKGHFAAVEILPEEYQTDDFMKDAIDINPYVMDAVNLRVLSEDTFVYGLQMYEKTGAQFFTKEIPKHLLTEKCIDALSRVNHGYTSIPKAHLTEEVVRNAIQYGRAHLDEFPENYSTRELTLWDWKFNSYSAHLHAKKEYLEDVTFWQEVFKLDKIGLKSPIPESLYTDEIADRIALEGGYEKLPEKWRTESRAVMCFEKTRKLVETRWLTESASLQILNLMTEEEKKTMASRLFNLPYELGYKYCIQEGSFKLDWIYKYGSKELVKEALRRNPKMKKNLSLDVYMELKEEGFFENHGETACHKAAETHDEPKMEIPFDWATATFEQLSLFDLVS